VADPLEPYGAQRQDALFQVLVALVLAVAEVLGVYLLLSVVYQTPPLDGCLGRVPEAAVPWPVALLVSRSILQPINLVVFALAANTLAIRLLAMPREFKAFEHDFFAGIPRDPQGGFSLTDEVRAVPLMNVQRVLQEYGRSPPLLVRRMEIGGRRLAEGGTAPEIHDLMQALAAGDQGALESRFTLVRYLIWLVPTIGFLGTVVGIGLAISRFAGVMSQFGGGAQDFQARLQANLTGVAGSLGTAFDTTLLALLLSALLVALVSIVQKREEELLQGIDEFCLRSFVTRMSVSDPSMQMMQQVAAALAVLGQGMDRLAKPTAAGPAQDMARRDLAGLIESQTERLRAAISQSPNHGGLDALRRDIERLADAVARAADRIQAASSARPGGTPRGAADP
jgi:biopolymer transport protein ExbB/TolQ